MFEVAGEVFGKLLKAFGEVTVDLARNFGYAVKGSVGVIIFVLTVSLPYIMFYLGMVQDSSSINWELIVPLLFWLVLYYFEGIANKLHKGKQVPAPTKRFTEVDEDGEVSIDTQRIQELLLYTADLEDWLERKGML